MSLGVRIKGTFREGKISLPCYLPELGSPVTLDGRAAEQPQRTLEIIVLVCIPVLRLESSCLKSFSSFSS